MGITVIGPTSQAFPSRATPVVVELKRLWSDSWTAVPQLEFLGANASTAAHDSSTCMLVNRYGILKHPWENSDSRRQPASIAGCWVRVMLTGSQGSQQVWIGKILGEVRSVLGPRKTPFGEVPSGSQCFEAIGPLGLLRRIDVSETYWMGVDRNGDTAVAPLDWLAPLNERYGRNDKPDATKGKALGTGPGAKNLGSRSGNRSPTKDGDIYVHGGYELWDYLEYAKYLLKKFVDESDQGGPSWTIGGQCEVLSNFDDPIEFGVVESVEAMLRRIIQPQYGLDYHIAATEQGFEIRVFVLTRQSCGWGGMSIPGNPDAVRVYAGRTKDAVKTTVETSKAQRYGTIQILGGRIVVCCSLHGSKMLPNGKDMPGRPEVVGLTKMWNSKEEMDYIAGTGVASDASYLHDAARLQEKFHDVYRKYGASKDWYYSDVWRAPWWDGSGEPGEHNGPMQQRVRSTLGWLPLETGIDYSQKPYVDNNPTGTIPTLRPPQVWLYEVASARWLPADKKGIGISALHNAIGMFLHSTPNHAVADTFTGASSITPSFDPRYMIATLAYQTDQRMYCEQKIPDALPSDGILEIDASDCQFWWLAPGTFLDIDASGNPVLSPIPANGETAGMIVRNDWARIAAKMAGAIARHYQDRARAQIIVRGLLPWGGLLGQILTVIDEGGDQQTIEAAITDVRWVHGEHPTTIISTGFATE